MKKISFKFISCPICGKSFKRRKLEISSSEFETEAKINKALTEDERLKVERLINMIDEDEDVQNVYHDMKNDN